jgi:hypothetical protein
MIGAVLGVVAAFVPALVPATTGAGAARPAVVLRASPARLALTGSTRAVVRVTNSGTKRVLVDVSRAGFALDLRGRPRIVRRGGARSAARWLTFRPTHFALRPRAGASLAVSSKLPRHAEPGDHDALVLLNTRPLAKGRVAVRLRIGLVVVVRAPGKVVRRLELHGLRVTKRGKRRALDVVIANRGNVTESLQGAHAVVSRAGSGRHIATLVASGRDLRPRTRAILEFRFRGRPRGVMTARVVAVAGPGRRVLRRTYRIRL